MIAKEQSALDEGMYPIGIIPRIENSSEQIHFINDVDFLNWIMIDINIAEQMLNP